MPDYATQPYGPRATANTASAGGGIDVKTLFLTACASAAAAYTCSKIWAPGTLASAAFTPVLVAIIKEALAKPTEVVARAVPVRGVARSARPQDPQPPVEGWTATSFGEAPAGGEPSPPADEDPATRVAQAGEIQYHGSRSRLRGWRLAVVTGLLGFLVCAVVFTVPELVAGRSALDGGRETTIFGGSGKGRGAAPAVTTQTTTAPTKTVTAPPTKTVTVPAPATTTTTPPAGTPTTTVPTTTNPDEPATGAPPVAQPPG